MDLIGERTVPDLLLERTARRPDATWLVDDDGAGRIRSQTYSEFTRSVSQVAAGLRSLGVGVGSTVVIHLDNGIEYVQLLFACAWLGAIAVPSNTASTARELEHVLTVSEARHIVTQPAYADVLRDLVAARGLCCVLVGSTPEPLPGSVPYEEVASAQATDPAGLHNETPMEIVFTSGTTSAPRGVVLTHANWVWSGERTTRSLLVDDRDTFLTCLPLFHVNAQSLSMLNALTANGTLVLGPKFSASGFLPLLARHRATHTSMVAMMVRALLARPESTADRDHVVRRVSYAINVSDAERLDFERRFAMTLINGYGLSEAMTEVVLAPVLGPDRWPSIGLPALGREVRLVTHDGREAEVGEAGEITVRGIPGRTIMAGYHRDPEATARTIVDGWLRTGDVARRDGQGWLFFVDRAKDIIKRAGENISASEVEHVLGSHPDVESVGVVAVPDAFRDEAVKACVVLREGSTLTEEELATYCGERLSAFKVPTVWEFWDALPTTSIGKIEKKRLVAGRAAAGQQS
jgi:carnitine-CoA ligase